MKTEIAQGLLLKLTSSIFEPDELDSNRKNFQTMAKYKYDWYQQYSTGMRFIERLALWLNQFEEGDRKAALNLISKKLIYISSAEMDLLVSSAYHDTIKPLLIEKVGSHSNETKYNISKIVNSEAYKILLRQSLFCGLSDGAKTDIFRRSTTGIITHEQVYQTYELSDGRAEKMQEELINDLTKWYNHPPEVEKTKFKMLFLLDDFSASGTSYLKYDSIKNKLKGKINSLYSSIFQSSNAGIKEMFDTDNLEVHIILYLCTEQAEKNITSNFSRLQSLYQLKKAPQLHIIHKIPDSYKLTEDNAGDIINICLNDRYYDQLALEDKHTGSVRLGFSDCALPVVLNHNCPNNSLSILWAYDNATFGGLFPRIPRHKEI